MYHVSNDCAWFELAWAIQMVSFVICFQGLCLDGAWSARARACARALGLAWIGLGLAIHMPSLMVCCARALGLAWIGLGLEVVGLSLIHI